MQRWRLCLSVSQKKPALFTSEVFPGEQDVLRLLCNIEKSHISDGCQDFSRLGGCQIGNRAREAGFQTRAPDFFGNVSFLITSLQRTCSTSDWSLDSNVFTVASPVFYPLIIFTAATNANLYDWLIFRLKKINKIVKSFESKMTSLNAFSYRTNGAKTKHTNFSITEAKKNPWRVSHLRRCN